MYRNKSIACVVLNYNTLIQTSEFINEISKIECIDNIIVVDNCSTDDSYSKLVNFKDEKVCVKKTSKNGGYGYGNNYGVRIAKDEYSADYTIISNPDVKFDEDLLHAIIDVFIEERNVAIVSSLQKNGYTGQVIRNCGWRVPTFCDYLSSSLVFANKVTSKYKYTKIDPQKTRQNVGCVPGAFLVIDTDKFLSFGGYDERIFLFCEESILGYRVEKSGFRTMLLTQKYYSHFHSTSVKKSIPSALSRHKMVLDSRKVYLEKYLNISGIRRLIASVVFSISMLEYRILYIMKK